MNEMTIRRERNGAAAVPGGQLLLGYAGNRGNYRLRIEQRGEWKGLTVCAHWHTPGASAATLVENGILTVPAAVLPPRKNRRCWPYCARWRRAMTQPWQPATVWRRCGATRSRRRRIFLPCWGRRSLEK